MRLNKEEVHGTIAHKTQLLIGLIRNKLITKSERHDEEFNLS